MITLLVAVVFIGIGAFLTLTYGPGEDWYRHRYQTPPSQIVDRIGEYAFSILDDVRIPKIVVNVIIIVYFCTIIPILLVATWAELMISTIVEEYRLRMKPKRTASPTT